MFRWMPEILTRRTKMTKTQPLFTDERTDVMGAHFDADADALLRVAETVGLCESVKFSISLIDAVTVKDQPVLDFDLEHRAFRVKVPVTDQFEYSERALSRVNRTLFAGMRAVAQTHALGEIFSPAVAYEILSNNQPILRAECYGMAKAALAEYGSVFNVLVPREVPTASKDAS